MKSLISFLIFHENENIVTRLSGFLADKYPEVPVFHAASATGAGMLIRKHNPAIVISQEFFDEHDLVEICNICRHEDNLKYVYFIALLSNNDPAHIGQLAKKGIDDAISLPLDYSALEIRIKFAVRILDLQSKVIEENHLLQKLVNEVESEYEDLLKLSFKFFEKRIPGSSDLIKRVIKSSLWILEQFPNIHESDIKELKLACHFCIVGRMSLPDNLINLPINSNNIANNVLLRQVPYQAKEIVAEIKTLKGVADLLYHVYENLDGTGFPDQLQAWQIPLGSRIIRVVLDFEEALKYSKKSPNEIIQSMKEQEKKIYDNRIIHLLEQYLQAFDESYSDINEKAIKIEDLAVNNEITRDIIAVSGIKLIPKGSKISARMIEILLSHMQNDPVLGYIFIKK